jgi:hypothetical protein
MKAQDKTIDTEKRIDAALDRCEHKAQRLARTSWIDILDDIDDMNILKEAVSFCRQKSQRNAISYAIWHPRKVRVERLIETKRKRINGAESGVE